ncbi:hypothetical protein LTR10_003578 [Elasticomyces elasticus]|nr:hypothetical protein LTR10_003578 [Elasticomyces elasticus]KAK4978226.1 hypothetical protein LTR42_002604 [Elasticomyces elasticus]
MLALSMDTKEEVCTPSIFKLPPELRVEIFLALFCPEHPDNAPGQTQVHTVGFRPEDQTLRAWSPDVSNTWEELVREDNWWREDCQNNPAVGGLNGFENVTTINVEMVKAGATFWSSFPPLSEMRKILEGLTGKEELYAMNLLGSISTFKMSTYTTLRYLLSKLPMVNKIILSGYTEPNKAGLKWHGIPLQPLEESSGFVIRIKSIAEEFDIDVEVRRVEFVGYDCYLCCEEWDSAHWTPQNPAGHCELKVDPTCPQTADYEDGDLLYSKWEELHAPEPPEAMLPDDTEFFHD